MSPFITIPQQYLYISKIRSKLSQCALAKRHHRDLDLRKMVGHANLLDRVLDEIDALDGDFVLYDGASASTASDASSLGKSIRPISIM
ncbi:hypothetical protein SUVZ_10G2970 [Saccharomyces uvarum]|uniref:Uncharacterized protein n=1 Tax=Saccharomyces uvarum TaxID=230603 RepID=A0ABN8WJC4_SACUV|nr:hypothetical protein SUVZ_10G2970 [Saccharomyces uvarum]